MKRALLLSIGLLAVSAVVSAQDNAEYQTWMKIAAASTTNVRKNLDAKAGVSAAADAKRAQDVFEKVADYWQKKDVSDAVKFAQDARDGFKQVSELATTGKFEEASEALKAAQANCAGCHSAHREKAEDGSFKMK